MGGPVRELPSHTVARADEHQAPDPVERHRAAAAARTEVETLGLDAGADPLVGTPFLGTIGELRDHVVFADVLSLPDPP
jgi:hypothetical protein